VALVYRRPFIGLLAFVAVLLGKPVSHALPLLIKATQATSAALPYLICAASGVLGFWLIWWGRDRDELTSTIAGYFGGTLVLIGWIEGTFTLGGALIGISKLQAIEFSLFIYLTLLVFFWMNKDSGCRMFMFINRHLRLRPGRATVGYRKNYARITALETIFIVWGFYLISLLVGDPRMLGLGLSHPVAPMLLCLVLAWGLYLLVVKMPKHDNPGLAIRYGIASVNVLWFCAELASLYGVYRQPWMKPFDNPGFMLTLMLGLVFAWVGLMRSPGRGQAAALA
jgi:hypothetical protein